MATLRFHVSLGKTRQTNESVFVEQISHLSDQYCYRCLPLAKAQIWIAIKGWHTAMHACADSPAWLKPTVRWQHCNQQDSSPCTGQSQVWRGLRSNLSVCPMLKNDHFSSNIIGELISPIPFQTKLPLIQIILRDRYRWINLHVMYHLVATWSADPELAMF